MVFLCIAAVKVLAWFANLPSVPHRGEESISENPPPNALPPRVVKALGNAGSIEIHLLGIRPQSEDNPESEGDAQGSEKDPTFHGWPVLGSAHENSGRTVESIIRSVLQGVERHQREPMACFLPRHGVRVSLRDGSVVDLVICYWCEVMEVHFTPIAYEDLQLAGVDLKSFQVNTLDDSRELLNQVLQATGVDLNQEVVPWLPKP
jgi:hypothetical protein